MPRPPRFFISADQLSGSSITIKDDDVRHIATVLRMKTGDELLLCDGQGTDYAVKITRMERAEIGTEIVGQSRRELRLPRVTLGQGIPKADKMDWIVQKSTELGVAAIIPLVTERTIVKVKDEEKRLTRWRRICREAAMQSQRPDIPRIGPLQSFRDFLTTLAPGPADLLLMPWEEGTEPLKNMLRQRPDVRNIIILIGPEGGFSTAEAGAASERGFQTVSLGPSILRTETAAIATLAMIGYEY